jgi:hypothetical protein
MKSDSPWLGSADLHDAHIRTVARTGTEMVVELTSYDGCETRVRFSGVAEVAENRPIGMMIYGLLKDDTSDGGRRFVFVNWDDADDASLEIVASDVTFD